jgi:hypothetical protein
MQLDHLCAYMKGLRMHATVILRSHHVGEV